MNEIKQITPVIKKEPNTLKELFEDFDYKKYWSDWEKDHPNKLREFDLGKSVGGELL